MYVSRSRYDKCTDPYHIQHTQTICMAASRAGRTAIYRRLELLPEKPLCTVAYTCPSCFHIRPATRHFAASARRSEQARQHDRASFGSRLRTALRNTKVEWYPIPVGLGIGFLGFAQLYRVQQREKIRQEEQEEDDHVASSDSNGDGGEGGRPKRRKRIRPSGPWLAKSSSARWELFLSRVL